MVLILTLILLILSSKKFSVASTCQDSESSTVVIKSSTFVEVVDINMNYLSQSIIIPSEKFSATISDTNWIWKDTITAYYKEIVYFRLQFNISSVPREGALEVAADDSVVIKINEFIANECNAKSDKSSKTCNIGSSLKAGVNTLLFSVTNYGTGGLAFKLTINT